jgi:hypothetical protein
MHETVLQYLYYNIFLLPETSHTPLTAEIFVGIGALCSLATALILAYLAYKDRKEISIGQQILYYVESLFFLWATVIYSLATFGALSIPTLESFNPPSYGNYLRPILAVLLLSPALIALVNRRIK